MHAFSKALFVVGQKGLFAIRPLLGNRRYTKIYIEWLKHFGVDIQSFDACGFIAPSVELDKYRFGGIHIGKNVYITHDVILLVHDQSAVTAWNAVASEADSGTFYNSKDIYIGDNVFIGMRSIILPGSRIGNNVVIGAGSIVKGAVPDGTVWAGNPARMIEELDEYRIKLGRNGGFSHD